MIEVSLNGIVFQIPTRGEKSWQDLTDWCLEVNETLANQSTSFNIPAGSANLVDNTPVSLYTINTPQTNAHIIFDYGIYRRTTGVGATSVSETGQLYLAYNTQAGTWETTNTAVGNASVTLDVSSNTIRATASTLTGTPDTSQIFYRGIIIRV
jgi:hypothetical protein